MLIHAYHGFDAENVTIVTSAYVIFCYVCKMCEIVRVLTGAMNVSDFMLANQFLSSSIEKFNASI